MRIDPDTRDSLAFLLGFVGAISQGILVSFGVPVSLPLLGFYGSLITLGVGGSVIKGSGKERGDDRPRRRKDDENE